MLNRCSPVLARSQNRSGLRALFGIRANPSERARLHWAGGF